MHLRSVTIKGFKSFPDRTRLEFSPGVSVIVGPNGSGKSNVAEAVLWALGEQSPSAVRGQTMQDVIFAGGHGVPSRSAAEVEVVLDNSDPAGGAGGPEAMGEARRPRDAGGPGGAAAPGGFSEVSIARYLDRSGDGGYRLNGARCRLVDVAEVLSDTGLGREMHSVVSQGKVEAIVHSRPRERRLLIEEAAGLGKHRRRRRRAELKLAHTRDNLERALDIEREARSGLRPLKRQAEAAELHERLERQWLEARLELVRDELRAAESERAAAEEGAATARAARDDADRLLTEVAQRRERAEAEFAEQARARERLSARVHAARSAQERIALRAERARETARAAGEGAARGRTELERLEREAAAGEEEAEEGSRPAERIAELEREIAALSERAEERRLRELAGLEHELREAEEAQAKARANVARRREQLGEREREADAARSERREAERAAEAARARSAAAGAELASANAFLRAAGSGGAAGPTLADELAVEAGYEAAVAAVLGRRLGAVLADDAAEAEAWVERAGRDGASALFTRGGSAGTDTRSGRAPTQGAERLHDKVTADGTRAAVAARLLADVWVVDALPDLVADFEGIAVTRAGRVLDGRAGEVWQAPAGGGERVLEERNRRQELIAASEAAAVAEAQARARVEAAQERVREADRGRDVTEDELRSVVRSVDEAADRVRRLREWLARRGEDGADDPEVVHRTALEAELRAERGVAERLEHERRERARRRERLAARVAADDALRSAAERAAAVLASAEAAVAVRREEASRELEDGAALGECTAAELRACARREAELQGQLRTAAEAVTAAEVRAERARDHARERREEFDDIGARLGLANQGGGAESVGEAASLSPERRSELEARLERVRRRREQLGPVNPLAGEAYAEALAHVEELEGRRVDLERALGELESLIADIDRRIRTSFEETFAAAAANFEDVVTHLFPGGRGRLRLVRPDGGGPEPAEERSEDPQGEAGEGAPSDAFALDASESEESTTAKEPEEPGVEVEVTPAGKATRRLSLLSGGEKSLVAIAFLFAVFLARPCPFYILDEVEAALDDLNIDRFLELLRRYSDRAQFIVVTHQRRTMDAADRVYGVSMGADGVSRVVSRRLPGREPENAVLPDTEPQGGPASGPGSQPSGARAAARAA